MDKLKTLKAITGGGYTDELLSVYLDIAKEKILNIAFPYDEEITEIPKKYDLLHVEIATYLLNKRGAEGQTSHNENNINRSYESSDIPKSLTSQITPHVGTL